MRLSELIAGERVRLAEGDPESVRICDITEDSRTVVPGSLFIARAGAKVDGRRFIASAIEAGAVAVLTDDVGAAHAAGCVCLVVEDVPLAGARLAERYFGAPSSKIVMIGVTGTNGKTTVSHIVHQILNRVGVRCGLIGTVDINDGATRTRSVMTTPPAVELSRTLAAMVDAGCRAVVMEVSSHALDQDRCAAISFDVGVMTNLSRDHLDYHGTMEAYAEAKRKLFTLVDARSGGPGLSIVNADDPDTIALAGRRIAACSASGMVYGGWHVRMIEATTRGAELRIHGPGVEIAGHVSFIGAHNAMNLCQACAAVTETLAILREPVDFAALSEAVSAADSPRGRLEPAHGSADDIHVFIDFAHTDDALNRTLAAVRGVKPREAALWVVFGAGGDRDRGKRPGMGRCVALHADWAVLTSDNPRSEDPEAIIAEVLRGVPESRRERVIVQADRERAIREAIKAAAEGDVIVIAGKGHETEQITRDANGMIETRHFDDLDLARQLLRDRRSGSLHAEEMGAGR